MENDACGENSLNFNYMKHGDQIFIAFATPEKCHQTLLIVAGGQGKKSSIHGGTSD